MNNNQFRRLLADSPSSAGVQLEATGSGDTAQACRPKFTGLLPRNLKRSHDAEGGGVSATKKFKSSTPKGSDVAHGYVDRAKARNEAEDESDEKATKIKELEEQRKIGELSTQQFEALRDEITGGDIGSTHLVKGLDRRLLERVRRGEDVLATTVASPEELPEADLPPADVDDELDRFENAETSVAQKHRAEKQGVKAVKQKSRDEIMAELKAKRKADAEAQRASQPQLSDRWRRIDDKTKSRIEVDKKGREVLITVDEDGVVKKRVRKAVPAALSQEVKIDPAKPVLGAELSTPVLSNAPPGESEDESDDDIFAGVGADYDPLGEQLSDDDDIESRVIVEQPLLEPVQRNYFNEKPSVDEQKPDHLAGIKNVIERAAKLSTKAQDSHETEEDVARRAKHAQMLANRDRDLDDMDMGFGASRDADGEDGETGEKVKLSEWRGAAADDDQPERRTREKKKRKPKKRKGDANSIADIMGVIEKRKKEH